MLKLIQLGMTVCDKNGNPPPGPATWQFHFKFDLAYVPSSLAASVARGDPASAVLS